MALEAEVLLVLHHVPGQKTNNVIIRNENQLR